VAGWDVEEMVVSSASGGALDVIACGPQHGRVLMLHLGTPNGLVMPPAVADLAERGVRTVVYARPGYCRSTVAEGRCVADAATDTEAILDRLGVDTFVNVGWSGGGPHALACAALLAERCQATAVIAGMSPSAPAVEVALSNDHKRTAKGVATYARIRTCTKATRNDNAQPHQLGPVPGCIR
jgi:pimeloyl-ACP methyl ester carboxylesterase